MKKRNSFLAVVLSAAIAVTAILPAGGITANAAQIKIETTKTNREAYANEDDWSDSSQTESEEKELFGDPLFVGGVQAWNFNSNPNKGSGSWNASGDLTAPDAAAVVFASREDIRSRNNVKRTMSFDFVPLAESELRFGIMLKYVDATHWVYLGYDAGADIKWFLQWKNGDDEQFTSDDGTYSDGRGFIGYDGEDIGSDNYNLEAHKITSDDNNAHQLGDGSLEAITLSNGDESHWTRIKIVYEDSSHISVTATPVTVEYGENNEKISETLGDAKTVALSYKVFHDLRDAADAREDDESNGAIYFGFRGGTWNGKATNIDIANVKVGTVDGEERALEYGNCGWDSPTASLAAKDIITRSAVNAVGYTTLGEETEDSSVEIYDTTVTDFNEGTVSTVFRPYEADKEFYLGAKYEKDEDNAVKGIQIGYNGTKWVYKLNGVETVLNSVNVPVEARSDYKVTMTIDQDQLTASVQKVKPNYDAEEQSDPVGDSAALIETPVSVADIEPGSIALTAKKGWVRVRNVNYTKVERKSLADSGIALGNYNTIKALVEKESGDSAEHPYYKDKWDTFMTTWNAQSAILDGNEDITPQEATSALALISEAYEILNVDANKISTGQSDLNSKKFDLDTKSASEDYQINDQTKVDNGKAKLTEILTKITEHPETVTSTDVAAAQEAYNEAIAAISAKTMDDTDEADIAEALTKEISADEEKYYDAAKWNSYANALQAVKDLGKNATKVQVKAALEAFHAAVEALTEANALKAATADEINAAATKISGIETAVNGKFTPDAVYTKALEDAKKLVAEGASPTLKALDEAVTALEAAQKNLKAVPLQTPEPTVKAGDVVTSGKMDYMVSDVTAKTVVLKEGKDIKQKKVTIPAAIMIGKDSYKVIGVAANAFKNYKNIKNITIGANVTSIAKKAFPNCAKLTKVTFKTSKVTLSKNAFAKAKKTVKVKVPKSLKKDKKFVKSLKKAGLKKYKL